MSDDSIPRRRRGQQIPAEQAELSDPATLAIEAILTTDTALVQVLQSALDYKVMGHQVKYAETRAHAVELLGAHPDYFALCGYDHVRVQEHVDSLLALSEHVGRELWCELWWRTALGIEIKIKIPLDPDFSVPRVAKRSPDSPWILKRDGAWLADLEAAPALTTSQRVAALGPLMLHLARQDAQRRGERFKAQGKSEGDGALWLGGLPDFLDDLWTALESRTRSTGTAIGHDPISEEFRRVMREQPAAKTMYKWLRKAKLRARDIREGKVTRKNYGELNAT